MESTASYHLPLFSYLTAQGYQVVIINSLLINHFAKRSLRKTKTDKKDAFTIAQFLYREKETFAPQTTDHRATELKDLARRREKLVDHVTSLKGNMKRILSVIFPELEHITGVFTKATLRLLTDILLPMRYVKQVMMPLLKSSSTSPAVIDPVPVSKRL